MTWTDVLLAGVLGSSCVGCDRPGRPWCPECSSALAALVDPLQVGTDPITVACVPYVDRVPDAIVGFKDRGVRMLGGDLAEVLAAGLLAVRDLGVGEAAVVPAPSAPGTVRRRGFDHMSELARRAAGLVDQPCRQLLRGGRRADQAGLGFSDRRRNVGHTVRARESGRGPVVLVDDVTTSGATLAECDRALRAGGYTPLAHVVIATAMSGPDVRSVAGKG